MALLNTYDATNLVIDSGLVVSYSISRISGSWVHTSSMGIDLNSYDHMWEAHRRARQSFRYVGMTKAAADECKAAMVTKYTRTTKEPIWDSFNGAWSRESSGSNLMAEVSESHNEDGSYDVVVNVNEDDSSMAINKHSAASLAVDFLAERSRNYEGGEREGS